MSDAELSRLGCRVLDKDGFDWNAIGYEDGYAEWKAIERATTIANNYAWLGALTVVDADGVTLHTIPANREGE